MHYAVTILAIYDSEHYVYTNIHFYCLTKLLNMIQIILNVECTIFDINLKSDMLNTIEREQISLNKRVSALNMSHLPGWEIKLHIKLYKNTCKGFNYINYSCLYSFDIV